MNQRKQRFFRCNTVVIYPLRGLFAGVAVPGQTKSYPDKGGCAEVRNLPGKAYAGKMTAPLFVKDLC